MTELETVLQELIEREPIFHQLEWGTTRLDFEAMTAEDFWEVGASGTVYPREFVLDLLERRHAHPQHERLEAAGFACRKLGPDCYLLTYELLQEGVRRTRRATIWERVDERWRIVYHQGTLIAG